MSTDGDKSVPRAKLTEGPIGPMLIKLTIPMIFGILSMAIYNIVDTYFVGRLGKEQLAALAFTFPVIMVVQSISHGIGMGTSAVVSRALGARDKESVHRYATDSLVLGLLIVGICAVAGLLTIEPLFRLLGAGEEIIPYIREYMSIWYLGVIFVVVPMIGNNSIRATGDTRTPGIIMVIGALINAIFDPLLIFGLGPFPALGIRGAAVATLIGRSSTFFVAIYVLAVRERLLCFTLPRPAEVLRSWKDILHIGIPNAATKMITPLGAGAVTRIISVYGPLAVAGYGVATRIEFFALTAINALSSVIGPFIGQNIGAGLGGRVKTAFKKSELYSGIIGTGLFLFFLVTAPWVARLFNEDIQVYSVTTRYLRIVSCMYGLQGFYFIVVSGLNVLKKPLKAASLSLMQMFILIVPLSLLGSRFFGITGVFAGIAVSYAVTGLASRSVLLGELKHYTDDRRPV